MTTRIQILLIVGTLIFFLSLLSVIRKDKLSSDMACLWIIFSLILVIMAISPDLANKLSHALGIYSAINALYVTFIFLLLCFVFYLFMKISELEKKINNLIQRYAIDEEKRKEKNSNDLKD